MTEKSNPYPKDIPNSVPTIDSPHDLRQSNETPHDSTTNETDQAKVNAEGTKGRDIATGADKS